MRKGIQTCCVISFAAAMVGCTTFGDTTQVGATAGGAMGAGLGAVIGSQTGDAVGGFALGAVAGAGSGAAIGNVLQAQQEAIQTQDEAIERQQQVIRAQAAQIEELRRLSQDSIQFDTPAPLFKESAEVGSLQNSHRIREANLTVDVSRPELNGNIDNQAGAPVSETQIIARMPDQPGAAEGKWGEGASGSVEQPRAGMKWKRSASSVGSLEALEGSSRKIEPPVARKVEAQSDDCIAADKEVQKAEKVIEVADKLFHNRRALRLCPNSPSLHHSLAHVYLALGRMEDAKFELEEALRLDPSYGPATLSLKNLASPETVVY